MSDKPILCSGPEVRALLNAKSGYGWDQNPWVAAYTFTVERGAE